MEYNDVPFTTMENPDTVMNISIVPSNIQAITTWETLVFEKLCAGNRQILVSDLADAYDKVMRYYGMPIENRTFVQNTLQDVFWDETYLVSDNKELDEVITEGSFYRTIKYYANDLRWRVCNYRITRINNTITHTVDWSKYVMIIVLCVLDVLIGAGVAGYVSTLDDISAWLVGIYIGASLCAANLMYYLLSSVNLSTCGLGHTFDIILHTEYIGLLRRWCMAKFAVLYIIYMTSNALQVRHVLNACLSGCSHRYTHIVRSGHAPIVVSWGYFLQKPLYWLSIFVIILVPMLCLVGRNRVAKFWITVALTSIIIIQQAIDMNTLWLHMSLIPTLIIYIIDHWYDVYYMTYSIERCITYAAHTQIPVIVKNRVSYALAQFNCIWVYVHHDSMGKHRWMKCLMTNDSNDMQNIILDNGCITNDLVMSEHPINIGYCNRSRFGLYSRYETACVFCKDAGIHELIAMIDHRESMYGDTNIVAIWLLTDIRMVKELKDELMRIKKIQTGITLHIHYSPSVSTSEILKEDIIVKFNYLQCVIHRLTGIDILAQVSCPAYCMIDKLSAYSVIDSLLLLRGLSGKKDAIGIFACGDVCFVEHVRTSAWLFKGNNYNIQLDIITECI